MGAPARIDYLGIVLSNVFDIDLQLLADRRQIVGQEDIALGGQLIDQLAAFLGGKVDADAALAPVGVLHQSVALLVSGEALQHLDAALGIAAHGMLDLDHVRAPVRQDRARRRNESELRDFEDPNALHNLGHRSRP